MKRDMELIRNILFEVEAHDSSKPCFQIVDANCAYQVALMKEAGLVEAIVCEDQQGLPTAAVILRLTWIGHDFLDSSRDNKLWKLAMDNVIKPGASWSFSILVEWLKREARRRLLGDQSNTPESSS